MNLMNKLRARRRARNESATTRFWKTLTTLVTGKKLSEKAHEEAVEVLGEAAEQLGKSPEDVEADELLLRELHALGDTDAELTKAEKVARKHYSEAKALTDKDAELMAELDRVRQQAEAARTRGHLAKTAAREAANRATELRRLLAKAGHPNAQVAVNKADTETKAQQLRTELGRIDTDLATVREALDDAHYPENVSDRIGELEHERAVVQAQLDGLEAQ